MDAGEYDTNSLLINNISSVAFRIYEPVASQSSSYTFNASDVESALRNDGHLAYMDSVRRGIWCFYLKRKETLSQGQPEQPSFSAAMEVCGYNLALVEEGFFEPSSLSKGRLSGTNAASTPSSSSSSGSTLEASTRGPQSTSAQSTSAAISGQSNASGPAGSEDRAVPSAPSESRGYGSLPVQQVHEFFIHALLASLSVALCRSTGAISLTPKTLLLPPQLARLDREEGLSVLATFRVYLTTAGSLVITLGVSLAEGLLSVDQNPHSSLLPGASVLAAPLGALASFQSFHDRDVRNPDHATARTPDTQLGRFRRDAVDGFSRWRDSLSRLLQLRGMSPSILNGCSWLNIQFMSRGSQERSLDGMKTPPNTSAALVAWPSVLCFRKPMAGRPAEYSPGATALPDAGRDFDPLNDAKAWHDASVEREEKFSRRRKEREAAAAAAARDHIEAEPKGQLSGITSPLALRRASNAGPPAGATAAGGSVYPTPPDGVQLPGVTPSVDGAVSSPANPPNAHTAADAGTDGSADVAMKTDQQPGEALDAGWGSDQKRDQAAIFLEGDNLFGDLGEDMFENNELTDADFSFFDEEPTRVDLDLPGFPDMDTAMDADMDTATSAAVDTAMDIAIDQPQTLVEQPQSISQTKQSQTPLVPVSPEFTKPELKHARSTLNDEARHQANLESFCSNASLSGIKRQPSPFNSDTVYKRIRASFHTPRTSRRPLSPTAGRRRGSIFEKVDFDPSLSLDNRKYQRSGQFDFSLPSQADEGRTEHGNTKATGCSQHGRGDNNNNRNNLPSNICALIARMTRNTEDSPQHQQPGSVRRDGHLSDDDDASLASDLTDVDDTGDEASSPAKSSVMRRRVEDDSISLAASLQDLEHSIVGSPAYGCGELPRLPYAETHEIAVTKHFEDPEPWPQQISCPDDDFITVAQILTEQAVGGTLSLGRKSLSAGLRGTRRCVMNTTLCSMQSLRTALPSSLSDAAYCQFRPFIEIQDVPLLGLPSRAQARPAGQEIVRPSLFQIPAPHIELRRYESQISVLPSAVGFWESLGLGPSQGGKDISAACVVPSWKGMEDNAGDLLDRMKSAYESLKLGTFERLPSSDDAADGCFQYTAEKGVATPSSSSAQPTTPLSECMSRLSQVLVSTAAAQKNFVVYFAYNPEDPGSIVESCCAFQELFKRFKKLMVEKKKAVVNELVLQLIPLDSVGSDSSLAILSPGECVKLCLETYDRCTSFGGSMPAPAIVLEQALPRMIEFKTVIAPSPDLLHENSCIHIAYAQSVDERWVTAAWTDNRGSKQMTASYCLGRRGRQLSTPLVDAIREIWETTHDLTSIWKVHWRAVVTKCGAMDQAEIECWTALAQAEGKASVSLVLVSVDTNPPLQLIPPVAKVTAAALSVLSTTPVNTPQPSSIVSPEQTGNPATPMGAANPMSAPTPSGEPSLTEPDADTTLVDVTETTWGAIASHRLNNSLSLTDLSPALQSGYLVKRGGPRPEDPPVAMEVNILYSDGNAHPRVYEGLLREMLGYFRGLGTLARLRGVVDRATDIRPWHVAAAEKGVQALYLLM